MYVNRATAKTTATPLNSRRCGKAIRTREPGDLKTVPGHGRVTESRLWGSHIRRRAGYSE